MLMARSLIGQLIDSVIDLSLNCYTNLSAEIFLSGSFKKKKVLYDITKIPESKKNKHIY